MNSDLTSICDRLEVTILTTSWSTKNMVGRSVGHSHGPRDVEIHFDGGVAYMKVSIEHSHEVVVVDLGMDIRLRYYPRNKEDARHPENKGLSEFPKDNWLMQ